MCDVTDGADANWFDVAKLGKGDGVRGALVAHYLQGQCEKVHDSVWCVCVCFMCMCMYVRIHVCVCVYVCTC